MENKQGCFVNGKLWKTKKTGEGKNIRLTYFGATGKLLATRKQTHNIVCLFVGYTEKNLSIELASFELEGFWQSFLSDFWEKRLNLKPRTLNP